ncbi:MAG: hypothetical protein CMJ75_18810 [Planctomycetaceae bacterium]|nr:hypothetical protein [Planctomycetaceae bacterium]
MSEGSHIDKIKEVADADAVALVEAEKQYGGSWKKRGGVGAFMMAARKWDRIENRVQMTIDRGMGMHASAWDIFEHIDEDDRPEGLIDDIRDLRRYLLLIESEMRARGVVHEEVAK